MPRSGKSEERKGTELNITAGESGRGEEVQMGSGMTSRGQGSRSGKTSDLLLKGVRSVKALTCLGLHFSARTPIFLPHFSHATNRMTNKALWQQGGPG